MSDIKLKIANSGVEAYITAQDFYYVDKTLLIRDILTDDGLPKGGRIKLITRPRRFGKTLTMDMIKTYFEKTDKDTSVYFQDKKIWQCSDGIKSKQGKYPVVFLSLRDADCGNWEDTYNWLVYLISTEFNRHTELSESTEFIANDIDKFNRIANGTGSYTDYRSSLALLTAMLTKYYKEKPIVIIDEYDTPIQDGVDHRYYSKVMTFMKGFMSSGLKTNPNYEFAMLTGVLQIAGENMFSGLNNFAPYSVLKEDLSEYFGFTRDEVEEMLAYFGHAEKIDEVCEWYDGYNFGNTEIFNPWSVLMYVENKYKAEPYWVNTARNNLLRDMLGHVTPEVAAGLAALASGETIEVKIDKNLTYAELNEGTNVYSLLLYSGYVNSVGMSADGIKYLIRVPNKEVRTAFEKEISSKIAVYQSSFDILWDAIEQLDEEKIETALGKFLNKIMSSRNTAYEDFYHCFMMCVGEFKSNKYYISPETESGDGFLDVCFEPMDKNCYGYIFEIKSIRKKGVNLDTCPDKTKSKALLQLKSEAELALEQINDNGYETVLVNRGIKNIAKIGVAFMGKHAKVVIER